MRYSFLNGYRRLTLEQEKECRTLLMKTLHITSRKAFRDRLYGRVEPRISEYRAIEEIFKRYQIVNIWGK